MGHVEDSALNLIAATAAEADPFVALQDLPTHLDDPSPEPLDYQSAIVAVFAGFDLEDRPLLKLRTPLTKEIVPARTTLNLRRDMIGREALVLCEGGDPYRPIIVGLLQSDRAEAEPVSHPPLAIQADDERYVISAEREIVLKCGDASITLTRAGKVLIKGNYILSRSAGYNKIKGAAVDIN